MQAAVWLIPSPGRVRRPPGLAFHIHQHVLGVSFMYTRATPGNAKSDGARAARSPGARGGGRDREGAAATAWSSSKARRQLVRKNLVGGNNKGRRNIWTRREDGSRFPSLPRQRSRRRNMQSQQFHGTEPVGAPGRKKQKRSADPSGREEPDDDGGGDKPPRRSRKTKTSTTTAIRGLLRDFFEQQLRLDVQRQEMMARQAQERLFFEEQWRQSMRRIEQERLMLEQAWVEREEQRRMREEDRAERRDALLTSLLTRLLQGDL